MRTLALVATVALFAPVAAAEPPSPIARAEKGDVMCYQPDAARKTCQSTASYKTLPNGQVRNSTVVLVGIKPVVVMETATLVTIRNGQLCGPLKASDIDRATYTVDGVPATPKQTELLHQQMMDSMATLLNADLCTTYVPSGNGLTSREAVDGVNQPKLDEHVIWVSRSDGYKVAP
ncbi:MAG: hypothetical protein ABI740_03565 [Alphaproteobacteria bacterium]